MLRALRHDEGRGNQECTLMMFLAGRSRDLKREELLMSKLVRLVTKEFEWNLDN